MRQPERGSSFAATVKAVLWSFVGIRGARGHDEDARKLNPVYVIVTGVIAAAIFVLALVVVVRRVVG